MNKIILKTKINDGIVDLSEYAKNIKYSIDSRNKLMRIEIIFENSNDFLFNELKEYLEYKRINYYNNIFYIKDDNFDFICSTKIEFIEIIKDFYIVTAKIKYSINTDKIYRNNEMYSKNPKWITKR